MNKVIMDLILMGEFEAVNNKIVSWDQQEIENFLVPFACKSPNIAIYGFIVNNLIRKEISFWHSMAAVLFLAPLCHFEGAYSLGLYHTRRAMALDTSDIGAKQLLLSYYNSPSPMVTKDEAVQIAQEILSLDPDNKYALSIIEELS